MIQTIIALLCAHALADFIFQNKWMVDNKRDILPLVAHIVVVFILSLIALGGALWPAIFIALIHLQIDFAKARLGSQSLAHFIADQGAHFVSIIVTALLWPLAYSAGFWPLIPLGIPHVMALISGAVMATRMGQFMVGKLMAPYFDDLPADGGGLSNGGAVIGLLERGLTFLLVIAGQATGVGFLIAAKSFLRVGTIEKNRKLAEYVIIGTLASIGWALLVAYGTQTLLGLLADG